MPLRNILFVIRNKNTISFLGCLVGNKHGIFVIYHQHNFGVAVRTDSKRRFPTSAFMYRPAFETAITVCPAIVFRNRISSS